MTQIINLPNTVINEEARAEELQRFHDIEQFINEILVPALLLILNCWKL